VPSPLRPPRLRPAVLAMAAALAACQSPAGDPAAPLQLSATTLVFTARPGSDPAPATGAVTVTGADGRPSATVGAGASGWLAAAVTGDGPYTLTVAVSSSALPRGLYAADVALAAGGARATVAVKLAVEDPPAPMTVRGRATYDLVPAAYDAATGAGGLRFASAVPTPVRGAVVRALSGTTELARTTTDASGAYTLAFTPPGSLGLSIQVLAQTAAPVIEVRDNADQGRPWAMYADITTSTTAQDLRATHGWTGAGYDAAHRIAAPFAILDAMYRAEQAFRAVRPAASFPALKVYWSPSNRASTMVIPSTGLIGTSHFDPGTNAIYVLGDADAGDTDEFDSHVIVHEWAHFLEANLSRSDSPGGSHSQGDVADPRLAFSEGAASAVAAMVLPETMYTDTFWQQTTWAAFGFDAETAPAQPDDPRPGPFSETTVLRLLYDLYDGAPDPGGFDAVSVGLGGVWDVLTGRQRSTLALTTLAPLVTGVRSLGAVDGGALDALLGHYGVGGITDDFGAGDARLAAMYTPEGPLGATPLPDAMVLGGAAGTEYNMWAQNQYYRVVAAGPTTTVTAVSRQGVPVGLRAYRLGLLAQVNASGASSARQTLMFASTPGQTYVVSLFGFATTADEYDVELTFASH
jgi:hypothetical protein